MSNSTLKLILASNQPLLFKKLLNDESVDYKELLYWLLQNGFVKVAKNDDIIRSIYTMVKFSDREKIKLASSASEVGSIEIIKSLLADLENKHDFTIIINYIFQRSAKYGHDKVVKMLLTNPKIDPSVNDNYAIRIASENGHTEVVKLLLTVSKQVDPSAGGNWAIRYASEEGHTEIVNMLLADPRVDPRIDNNYAIRIASENGHTTIVKLLLADPRVDPSANDNQAIRMASYSGYAEVVKLLLGDSRVDPSDSATIQYMLLFGHTKVVRLLSLHPKLAHTKQLNTEILATIIKAWLVI